jgi:hypothetical protein
MTTAAMLRRSGGMTLLVYACHTLGAAILSWPLCTALATAIARDPQPGPHAASLLLDVAVERGADLLYWSLTCIAGYGLLAPLLSMAWLHGMSGANAGIGGSLRRGLERYPAALALAACAMLAYGAAVALTVLALQYAPAALSPSEATENALRTALLCSAGSAALLIATLHDLARAALVTDECRPQQAIASGLQRLSFRLLGYHALLIASAAGAMLAAEAIGRVATAPLGSTLVLAPQQMLVFAATSLRGVWLTRALQAR